MASSTRATESEKRFMEMEKRMSDWILQSEAKTEQLLRNQSDALLRAQAEAMKSQREEIMRAIAAIGKQANLKPEQGVGEDGGTLIQHSECNRSMRYEFPKFNGDEFEGWVMRADYFFDVAQTPEEEKVKITAVHLEGRAMLWHRGFMQEEGDLRCRKWKEYTRAMAGRFGTQVYSDPLADIKNLNQTGSLHAYMNEFDDLYARSGIKEGQALSFFLAGLIEELQMPVRMFKPAGLAEAYALAKLQEVAVSAVRGKGKVNTRGYQNTNSHSGSKALTITTTNPKP